MMFESCHCCAKQTNTLIDILSDKHFLPFATASPLVIINRMFICVIIALITITAIAQKCGCIGKKKMEKNWPLSLMHQGTALY